MDTADFKTLAKKTRFILNKLLENSRSTPPEERLYTQKEVEKMVGRTRTTLAKLITKIMTRVENGELVEYNLHSLPINETTGRIKGYPFRWVQALREEAGTLPWRKPSESPFILAVIHFKGGVAKTESTINLSRVLGEKGYRVLVLDMDHQASFTGSFGCIPDEAFSKKDTIIPYMEGKRETLHYAIQKSSWPNIDYIPGCMELDSLGWALAFDAVGLKSFSEKRELMYELKNGIDTVSGDYDIVLIDSPPSSGMNSFEIIAAADGLVIPIPPAKHDLASTIQFLDMVGKLTSSYTQDSGEVIEGMLSDKTFKFIRFLVTKFQNEGNRSSNDVDFYNIARGIYGADCYEKVFRTISNIKEASRDFTSVYEVTKPNKKVLEELNSVFEQIELDILKHWPSKEEAVKLAGIGGIK